MKSGSAYMRNSRVVESSINIFFAFIIFALGCLNPAQQHVMQGDIYLIGKEWDAAINEYDLPPHLAAPALRVQQLY